MTATTMWDRNQEEAPPWPLGMARRHWTGPIIRARRGAPAPADFGRGGSGPAASPPSRAHRGGRGGAADPRPRRAHSSKGGIASSSALISTVA